LANLGRVAIAYFNANNFQIISLGNFHLQRRSNLVKEIRLDKFRPNRFATNFGEKEKNRFPVDSLSSKMDRSGKTNLTQFFNLEVILLIFV
jgi:hypothetical protein